MFLLARTVCEQLHTHTCDVAPALACGILLGKQQGDITQSVRLSNVATVPTNDWQLEPRPFAEALLEALRAGLLLQGLYCSSQTLLPPPAGALLHRWHYNVPYFVVSTGPAQTVQLCAFAMDPVLQKASELPVWIDQPPTSLATAAGVTAGALLGVDCQTGQSVHLAPEARRLSLYCLGAMGMGKTTLLLNIIASDIQQGDGVALLDPHGDLIDDILLRIPPHREPDVVMWDVADASAPFGLNFFACPTVTDPTVVDLICSYLMSVFYKLYYMSWGPQMENLLRVTFLTMLYNQDLPPTHRPTLIDVPRLWRDAAYRAYLTARVPHEPVRSFWETVYNPLRPGAQLEFRLSSSNKIERFLENRILYDIFGQTETSIHFRQVMDEAGVLLIKLPKGQLGEDNAGLLGSLIVGQLAQAAFARVDTPFAQRRPFHLVVDEYQNFATKSFAVLQTEARKFGLDTIVAHQTRAMLDLESKGATGAVGNLISFAVTGEDAKEMALMFDNTPPAPPVVGVQPIKTLSTSPWEHLLRHGHQQTRVNDLVNAMKCVLHPIPKDSLPNPQDYEPQRTVFFYETPRLPISAVRKFVSEEEVRRFVVLLNSYLYQRMQGKTQRTLATEVTLLQQLGPFYTSFRYYYEPEFAVVDVGKDEFILYGYADRVRLAEAQTAGQQSFYTNLEELAVLVAKEPIWADSGQFQPIRDRPRAFADVTAETANTLSTLPPYHALCKLLDAQGNRMQHLIQTYPPSPVSAEGRARAAAIRHTSRQRYGQPRETIAAAIAAHDAAWEPLLKRASTKGDKPKSNKGESAGAHPQPAADSATMIADYGVPTLNNAVSVCLPPGPAVSDEEEEYQ